MAMRRSRLVFGVIFVAVASLLFIAHLQSSDTLVDVQNGGWKAPLFSAPGWMSGDKSQESTPEEPQAPAELPSLDDLATHLPAILPPPKDETPSPEEVKTDAVPEQQFSAATSTPALSAPEAASTAFDNAKYPFQMDLDIPLPSRDISIFKDNWPHNYRPDGVRGHAYAYAALVNTHNPSIRDPYFMALQNLIWRVLWSPRAKTTRYPFIAFVAEYITAEQRALLAGAGAIVRELPPLDWNPPATDEGSPPIFSRFKDMFSKLHMWNQTDFTRILFLDADAFPVTNVDDMLDEAVSPTLQCNAKLLELDDYFPDGTSACEPYVMAAVPQGLGEPVEINVGAMVFNPSKVMYQRFLQNFHKYSRYVVHMADQGFLSWQFGQGGGFPATLLDRPYDGFFPQQEEKGKLKIVHEKLWAYGTQGWLLEEWESGWKEMLEWYDSPAFQTARENDEKKKPSAAAGSGATTVDPSTRKSKGRKTKGKTPAGKKGATAGKGTGKGAGAGKSKGVGTKTGAEKKVEAIPQHAV